MQTAELTWWCLRGWDVLGRSSERCLPSWLSKEHCSSLSLVELCPKLHDVWKCDMANEERAWIIAGEDRDANGQRVRWMCVSLWERRKLPGGAELRDGMGIEGISSVLKRNRLRWLGHVEKKEKRIGWENACIWRWRVQGQERGQERPGWKWLGMIWRNWA